MNLNQSEKAIKAGIWIGIFAASVCVFLGFNEWRLGHQKFFPRNSLTNQPSLTTETTSNDWGNYGSYLQGTTASLWALAAFFLIFVAFLAQQQQASRQSFENHFFQLLTLHNQIVDDLRELDGSKQGRTVFFFLHDKLEQTYLEQLDGKEVSEDTEAFAVDCYEAVFRLHQDVLGHYFRNLYHVVKFVDESAVVDKKRYTSIVRAQLSTFEHVFLHYNGLSIYGRERFKPLIERYSLLENMNPQLLANPNHQSAYSDDAFGEDAAEFRRLSTTPASAQSQHPRSGSTST